MNEGDQSQAIYSEIGTRIRDLEDLNRSLKERIILLSQNLLTIKDDLNQTKLEYSKQIASLKKENDKMKFLFQQISEEINNFARKEEIMLVERSIKDFQPLEFARTKDVKEIVLELIEENKHHDNT